MAEVESEIVEAGAQIIWVLEENWRFQPGTPEDCRTVVEEYGSTEGWCVGDAETEPDPGTFDDSPFSVGRGFDIIVPRDTMEIVFTTNHGTPSGNENLDGEAVLEAVQSFAEGATRSSRRR